MTVSLLYVMFLYVFPYINSTLLRLLSYLSCRIFWCGYYLSYAELSNY